MTTDNHDQAGRPTMNLKAFRVGDEDIYAAESAERALTLANEDTCENPPAFDLDEVSELTDGQLDHEYPEFDEDERPTGGTTTVRKWLAEAAGEGWLAGSGW